MSGLKVAFKEHVLGKLWHAKGYDVGAWIVGPCSKSKPRPYRGVQ